MAESTQAPPAAGTFCWNELMTPDAGAAKRFYGELLGWTSEDMDMGEMGTYTLFRKGDQHVGGMMPMVGDCWEGVPPHWMSYVAVDDVDASTKKAEQLGGKVCVPPTDIPNVGRFSVITDPTGATISLFKGG
ncbi:MAG: VOC family protein [Planctomycetota bacterium]|nr:VOC family protein [Planctomycetota bacterium]